MASSFTKLCLAHGGYNPDWAVMIEGDEGERLYFVVETKGTLSTENLREAEGAKIKCGRAHFGALAVSESPAQYIVARSLNDVFAHGAGVPAKPEDDHRIAVIGRPNRPNPREIESRNRTLGR